MTEDNPPAPEAGTSPESGPETGTRQTDNPETTPARPARKTAATAPAEGERIAKVIARVGLASRRVAEKMILDGRVKVNGKVIDSPALDIGPGDRVVVDGKPLDAPQDTRLWLYYKPAGLVTTESDELGRRTIYDELPEELPRVMTVGRLDLNSEGLLLLTNDGELKRRLELPSTGWLRRYKVRVNGRPTNLTFDPLRRGVVIEGEEFAPMEISLDSQRGDNAWLTIGIREGRNREIRRAMEHVGLMVNRLIRLSYGPFRLTTMKEGEVAEVRRRMLRDQLGPLLPGNEDAEAEARPARGRPARPVRGGGAERPARKPFGAGSHGEGSDRPRKPFGRRAEGDGEAPRKPYARRAEDGVEGARKPYGRRPEGEGPRKPHAARDGEGPRKPYAPRDGEARKPYGSRAEGEDAGRKPYARRTDGDGPRKPHASRDGEGAKRPYASRDGGGARKPYAPRDGEGARTPYGRRPEGDGPRKPHAARDGEAPRKSWPPRDGEGARKPHAPRPTAEGGAPRKPRHKAGAPRGEGFAARPPRDDSAPRKPHAPRGEGEGFKPRGEGFKPRGEGKPGGFKPKSGDPGKPGGFKPRGDRPSGGRPGPRKGPSRQG